jgi:hypothetical protein
MEFSNRGTQPHAPVAEAPATHTALVNKKRFGRSPDDMPQGLRIASVVLLFSVTILLVAVAFSLYFGGANESKYVIGNDLQAVDITSAGSNGSDQIYFGNIKNLNNNFLILDNVYYIPSTTTSSNISLQPLVCQVDVPLDQMIINRSSVNWWENLQNSGKVATAISNYQKANPKGPTCPTTTSATTNSTTTTPTTTTTPATTTTKQ